MTTAEELCYLLGRLVSLQSNENIDIKDLHFVKIILDTNPFFHDGELYGYLPYENDFYYEDGHYFYDDYNADDINDSRGENPFYNEILDMDQQSEDFWSWF